MIYILNLLLVPIYYGLLRWLLPRQKAHQWFVWAFAIHAILFRALAYPFYFTDAPTYARAYYDISHFTFQHAFFERNNFTVWGRGYVALNWLLSRVSNDHILLFVTLSVVSVGATIWFYAKTSYSFLLTVMLYLLYPMMYLMGCTALRQSLSMAVTLVALYYIKNYKVSLPLALLASLFHTSGIVFFPFFAWRKLKFKRLAHVEILALVIVAVVGMRIAIGYLVNMIDVVTLGRNSNFASQGDGANIVPVLIMGSLIVLAMAEGLFRKCHGRDYEILNFLTYGFAISLFGLGLSGAGRLTVVFLYVVPVIVTYLYHYSKSLLTLNNIFVILLFALFVRQMYYVHSDWVRNFNYKFYWEMPRSK